MYEITRLRVRSVARIAVFLAVAFHLALGVILAFVLGVLRRFLFDGTFASGFDAVSLFLIWIAATVGVIVAAYLLGLFGAVVYNSIARWWGGIRCDLAYHTKSTGASRQHKHAMTEPAHPAGEHHHPAAKREV